MNRSLRIAMCIDGWAPIWGGGQVYVDMLSRDLAAHGVAVDLFTRDLPGAPAEKMETPVAGWRVFRVGPQKPFFNLPGRLLTLFTLYRALKSQHAKIPYDVVHAHTYLGVLPAYAFCKRAKVPLCVTMHGTNLTDTKQGGIFGKVEKLIVKDLSYDAMVSVTRKYLADFPEKNAVWIPVGVDGAAFPQKEPRPANEVPTLIFVGRLDAIKGLDLLFPALATLEEPFRLLIVGDGAEKERLQAQAAELGINASIDFLGFKNKKEIADLYRAADAFILASRSEGMPLTALEAMACGLPVIGTKVGELPHLITAGRGWLAEPNSTESLAATLKEAFSRKADWDAIGRGNAEQVRKEYSWERVREEMTSLYLKLAKEI